MKKYLLPLILILIFSVSFIIGDAQNPKYWINTWTEIEELGKGKFVAIIHTGHRVFLDKTDGQYRKHKLIDERPAKDYVLIQSAKCCVEIYPYYARFFDIQHKEVRLHEERWVVQRLFKAPDKWRDVGAYNPVISIEEYSEPAGDVVKVMVNYDTDYGELVVEYFQRDGNALKHNVTFKNTSGGEETFRVLQKWAGIVGSKCNGKNIPIVEDIPFLAFHDSDKPKKKFNIAENLYSMVFNLDGSEKTNQCLQRPISIETHAQGMKADFIYGNWVLAQDERLEIDPDTATLDDPTEDGCIWYYPPDYTRIYTVEVNIAAYYPDVTRAYVEWNIEGIPDDEPITKTVFKYHGAINWDDCQIREMLGCQPSEQPDNNTGNQAIYDEIGGGTVYVDPDGFPVVGINQSQDLGTQANTDLQSQLSLDWFAIGIQSDNIPEYDGGWCSIHPEEKTDAAEPKPTLYVEYGLVAVNIIFFSTPL